MKRTIVIKGPQQKALLSDLLASIPFKPVHEVIVRVHKQQRSWLQNKLQRRWIFEAAEQLDGNTPEELRGYCKLHLGVPILRNALPEDCLKEARGFRDVYDKNIRPLSYEIKLACMMIPIDFPITRIMTTKQKTQYLDQMSAHFSSLGCRLTCPDKQ
jgi:hypothetical protein